MHLGRTDRKLRLTRALADKIAAAAKENNRSMNAEIVTRLEHTFSAQTLYGMQPVEFKLDPATEALIGALRSY